jgi:hypothetical protein
MLIRMLSIIIFFASIAWMIAEPGYEPVIGIATSLIGLLTSWMINRNKESTSFTQTQNVGDHSIGIQAGGNVKIDTLKN